ncbi:DUF4097 family beta strand repeat-containing protein [Aciduricibacillus chroicocephali]|uniref:DUF4097 family beta strand repeat-containing protein n=1 Tax=Aciduricibacillus chroicocephali TaxID=3054939 RepID=A0ABY9KZK9_9BACI|nr:DUF4097 family beta strand repeat-containing protein [Bacillaceae bacterium 44XB]
MKRSSKVGIAAVMLIAIGTVASIVTYKGEKAEPFEMKEEAPAHFSSIRATADNAYVTIKPASDDKAKAVLTGTKKENRTVKLKSFIKDNQWHIVAKERPSIFFNIDFFQGRRQLKIYLPKKEYEKLYALTDNGKISINRINSKSIEAQSDNGKIEIAHLNANSIKAETANGRIILNDTQGKIEARADNGLISFKDTKGKIVARTENGKIDFTNPTITDSLDFTTDNGKIQLELQTEPKNLQLEARTDNGGISIFGKEYKNSAAIFGAGPHVNLQTDNGRIDVSTD